MESRAIVRVVFIALVLDLLAFTLPLPLFPRIIDFYTLQESDSPTTFLARTLSSLRSIRAYLSSHSGSGHGPGPFAAGAGGSGADGTGITGKDRKWEVVLLGGVMGSVFSVCQCVISPFLGKLSDKYGRRPVLLATMIGNILSAVIWLQSTTFASYMLSRLVGGLSEGNVQLSTAIISDVTTPATRSRSLALIGIAFSICFTFGPSLGAYFASRDLPPATISSRSGTSSRFGGTRLGANKSHWNVYAVPAGISVVLLVIETAYIWLRLPETRDFKKDRSGRVVADDTLTTEEQKAEGSGIAPRKVEQKESVKVRKARLNKLGRLHGLFLLLFSGAEFTLTFLTYDLFFASNKQNGMLLSYIGILSSLLQGGYVRPSLSKHKITELSFTRTGILSCSFALMLMSILPLSISRGWTMTEAGRGSGVVLYAIATGLALTSATAVTGLMGAAAGCCDEEVEIGTEAETKGGQRKAVEETLPRGRALGGFRSMGQLGRAIGPLLTTSLYWTYGPTAVYGVAGVLMLALGAGMSGMVAEEKRRKAGSGIAAGVAGGKKLQ